MIHIFVFVLCFFVDRVDLEDGRRKKVQYEA